MEYHAPNYIVNSFLIVMPLNDVATYQRGADFVACIIN